MRSPKPISRWQELTLLVALLACLWYPARVYFRGGVVESTLLARDLSRRVYIVTGANVGIGYETAAQLARQHAHVVLAVRSAARGEAAAAAIRASVPGADVAVSLLDLTSFASVRAFAADFVARHARLDGLVANAGVMVPPKATTSDGLDLTLQVNHYSHWLLVELLADVLRRSAPARIALLSSSAAHFGAMNFSDLQWAERAYGVGAQTYADSKLANALHARALARRLAGTGVTAVSVDPGAVDTELARHLSPHVALFKALAAPVIATFLKTPWQGAQTTLHVLLDEDVPAHSGAFYADCATHAVKAAGFTDEAAEALWAASEAALAPSGGSAALLRDAPPPAQAE